MTAIAEFVPKKAKLTQDARSKRLQAIQIAAQLPADDKDAREVLELAMELVDSFLSGPKPA